VNNIWKRVYYNDLYFYGNEPSLL